MAEQEVRLEIEGVRFINPELVNLFPGRSLEAIKGKQRQREYKQLVEELRVRRNRHERSDQEMERDREDVHDEQPGDVNIRQRLRPRRERGGPEGGGILLWNNALIIRDGTMITSNIVSARETGELR